MTKYREIEKKAEEYGEDKYGVNSPLQKSAATIAYRRGYMDAIHDLQQSKDWIINGKSLKESNLEAIEDDKRQSDATC